MTCCSGTNDKDAAANVYGVLATAGLREIVQQTQDANQVMAESIRHLEKADRAAALGYGQDIVQLHRSAGERANRLCRRQFSSVIEAIDERVSRDDWLDLVANARHEYDVREGRQLLEDAKAEVRATLLDLDTLPSTSTSRVAVVMDEAFDRVAADGLGGGMQFLRENLDRALSALAAPEMGRQPASPDVAAFYACMAGTAAIMAIAAVVCFGAPFCWCCYMWAILLFNAVNIGACMGLAYV